MLIYKCVIIFLINLFNFGCVGSWLLCWLSLVAVSRGYSLAEVCRLLTVVTSFVAELGL